jgi:hypothetical protein
MRGQNIHLGDTVFTLNLCQSGDLKIEIAERSATMSITMTLDQGQTFAEIMVAFIRHARERT